MNTTVELAKIELLKDDRMLPAEVLELLAAGQRRRAEERLRHEAEQAAQARAKRARVGENVRRALAALRELRPEVVPLLRWCDNGAGSPALTDRPADEFHGCEFQFRVPGLAEVRTWVERTRAGRGPDAPWGDWAAGGFRTWKSGDPFDTPDLAQALAVAREAWLLNPVDEPPF